MGRSEGEGAPSDAAWIKRRALVLNALVDHFNIEEISVLAFQLGFDWSDVPGGTKVAKAVHLIEACENRNKMPNLMYQIRASRPDVKWSF